MTDLILAWPRNCDYPLWRDWLRKNRSFFNEVFIVFTETNQGENFRDFVKEAMVEDRVTFLENCDLVNGEDWRNVAVNKALKQSRSEWVYFTEQDFFPDDNFGNWVANLKWAFDCFGVYDATRLHPCCIFCKREIVNKTRKDFAVREGVCDHFGIFQREVESLVKVGVVDEGSYKHFNGYSHNWRLISDGQKPNYKPEEFIESLVKSLEVSVPLNPLWVEIAMRGINTHSA